MAVIRLKARTRRRLFWGVIFPIALFLILAAVGYARSLLVWARSLEWCRFWIWC